MSIQITYPFDSPGNYTFDANKIEVAASKAKLKLINDLGLLFNQDFASDVGFTYDNDLAEFTGGLVRQKDKRPAGATLYASFSVNEDSAWGGNLNNGLVNGAVWDAGKIDLTGLSGKRLNMPAGGGNFDAVGAAGCIRFKYIPDYNGAPASGGHILELDTPAGNNNAIFIRHYGPSPTYVSIDLRDSSGASHWMYSPAKSFTQGQEYIFELNFDFNGTSRLFIDGVLQCSLNTSSWTRTAAGGTFKWGGDSGSGDFWLDDVILFDSVQHTANHAGELPYTYFENVYMGSKIELPQFSYAGIGAIQAFTDFFVTDANIPHYVINDLYWDGAAWSASNGTYAQANTPADILANIATLPASDTVNADIIFNSSNTLQMSCDDLTLEYSGQIYPVDNPSIEVNTTFLCERIFSGIETAVKTGSDEIKYHAKIGSDYYWINGVTPEITDGTYVKANTMAEWNAALAAQSLPTSPSICGWRALLHSDDGSTTPELDEISLFYDFYGFGADYPPVCILYGTEATPDGLPAEGLTITAILSNEAEYDDKTGVGVEEITTTTDSDGYWEIELVPNSVLTPDTTSYSVSINKDGYEIRKVSEAIIPNAASQNFYEL